MWTLLIWEMHQWSAVLLGFHKYNSHLRKQGNRGETRFRRINIALFESQHLGIHVSIWRFRIRCSEIIFPMPHFHIILEKANSFIYKQVISLQCGNAPRAKAALKIAITPCVDNFIPHDTIVEFLKRSASSIHLPPKQGLASSFFSLASCSLSSLILLPLPAPSPPSFSSLQPPEPTV